ncbi:MAG: F0F1 ATP synthase subunit A [bacterium]|nr:F0F1 ATP synthase subunit A [bacterium]
MLILAAHDPADHVLPHRLFKLFDTNVNEWWIFKRDVIPLLNIDFGPHEFYFTNHLLMTLVAAGLCLLIFPWVARSYARGGSTPAAPRGIANFFEAILQFIREDVARPVLAQRTDAFMPFLWTLFFFILFCNLLGMVPLGSIIYLATGKEHIGGTATGNLAVTGGLALCSFFAIHVSGVRAVYFGLRAGTYGHHDHGEEDHHGHAEGASAPHAAVAALPLYVWNFAPHVFQPGSDAGVISKILLTPLDLVMWAFLLVLEFIGAAIKPFALMIRLFANMIAGHMVLASIMMLIFVAGKYSVGVASALGCMAISCLELFVAFLQAYIFVFLSALFIGAAVEPEH